MKKTEEKFLRRIERFSSNIGNFDEKNQFSIHLQNSRDRLLSEYKEDKRMHLFIELAAHFSNLSEFGLKDKMVFFPDYISEQIFSKLKTYVFKNLDQLKSSLLEEFENESKSELEKEDKVISKDTFLAAKENNIHAQIAYYKSKIKKMTNENITSSIITLFAAEGFLYSRVNHLLKQEAFNKTDLKVFMFLLQTSIILEGERSTIKAIHEKGLIKKDPITEQEYIELFKEANYEETFLEQLMTCDNTRKERYNTIESK